MKYGFSKIVSYSFAEAIEKVTAELAKEGFGVLTTIDIQATLKKKLNVDFSKYTILGACNSSFAHKSLSTEIEIGLLLPCNVIVYEKEGATVVSAFNPGIMEAIIENPAIKPIADEVKAKLERAIEAL